MPRLSRGQCRLDRFRVTHFTQENDIWIFTHRRAHGIGKGIGIHTYFTLGDDGTSLGEQKLDRIFNGNDVTGLGQIDLVRQRCQGR